jgi:hypothetical protein
MLDFNIYSNKMINLKISYMKYIIRIFIFLNIVSIAACTKTLEVEPQQSINFDNAIETAQDVNAAVVGCYSILGGGALYGTNLFLLADLQASESYCSWRGTFQGQRQVANKTMTADNSEASRVWVAAYRGINNANLVLANINKVTDNDLKKQYEGEAKFIRGILHFELVRYYALPWGATADNSHLGIVIKTTPTSTETLASKVVPRNTVAQTYQQVISDLETAATLLPEDNGTRASKFTALAFLSRVYLQQKSYDKARDAANKVIESGYYSLNASVAAVFSNKNTKESIWEIQQNEQNNAGQSNDGMATFYANLIGIGRADVRINSAILAKYPGDFSETFSSISDGNNTSIDGSPNAWTGNVNFPIAENAYQAGGAIRIGESDASGSITSASLPSSLFSLQGDVIVSFKVKGWTDIEDDFFGSVIVELDGRIVEPTFTSKIDEDYETKAILFKGVKPGSKLKISSPSIGAIIDNVTVSADSRLIGLYYLGETRSTSFFCGKWKDFAQNLPVVRIAEMYLTRAECNLRLGTNVGASPNNDMAKLRNTQRTNTSFASSVTLDDVLKEREIELAFEGLRIHDLKRLEKSTGLFPWNSPKLIFPIPRREVDATGGVIIQNPGY